MILVHAIGMQRFARVPTGCESRVTDRYFNVCTMIKDVRDAIGDLSGWTKNLSELSVGLHWCELSIMLM